MELRPVNPFSGITVDFSVFDIEPDNDYVRVYYVETTTTSGIVLEEDEIWRGGGLRGSFSLSSAGTRAIGVRIVSDHSVEARGVVFTYSTHPLGAPGTLSLPSEAACPMQNTDVCNRHGTCTASGRCVCFSGYFGETCSGVKLCPGSPLCNLTSTVAISPGGSDTEGVGSLGDGSTTTPKPLATISKAVSTASNGSTVALLPGTYNNCGTVLSGKTLLIKGVGMAKLTCVRTQRRRTGASEALATPTSPPILSLIDCDVQVSDLAIQGGASDEGAGVYISGGSPVFTRVEVSGGVARRGGGLFISGGATVVLRDCVISGNNATSSGGGIFVGAGTLLTLYNVVISGCIATQGGGIFIENAFIYAPLLFPSRIEKCSALELNPLLNGVGIGGGVAFGGTQGALTGALTILSSNAHFGGAVGVAPGAVGNITGVIVQACAAVGEGGCVFAANSSTLIASSCVLRGCRAPSGGGGAIGHNASAVLSDGTSFIGCNATTGGGLYLHDGASVTGLSVVSSRALRGGGVAVSGNVTLSGTLLLRDNVALVAGGAVYAESGTLDFKGVGQIDSNFARDGVGGGIALDVGGVAAFSSASRITITGGAANIGGCVALIGSGSVLRGAWCVGNRGERGGGVYAGAGISAELANSTIADGVSSGDGGGIFVGQNGTLILSGVVLVTNNTAAANGAGIAMSQQSSLRGSALAVVTGNAARGFGGGIRCDSCSAIVGVTVTSNAAAMGGGISFECSLLSPFELLVTELIVRRNVASVAGGGMHLTNSHLALATVAITENSCVGDGGGLTLQASSIRGAIWPVIVSGNSAGGSGGNVAALGRQASAATSLVLSGGFAAVAGGGLAAVGTTIRLLNISVVDSVALVSGGGFSGKSSFVHLANTTVTGCTSAAGGGVALESTVLAVGVHVYVTNNTARSVGGGISVHRSAILGEALELASNSAKTSGGGLACAGAGGASNATNLRVWRNSAGKGGGVAVLAGARFSMNASAVLDNSGGVSGGGVSVEPGAAFFLSTSSVSRNAATIEDGGLGGGVHVDSGVFVASLCNLANNAASSQGGALYVDGRAQVRLTRSALSGNTAGSNGGGLSLLNGATMVADNVVFVSNIAAVAGSRGGAGYLGLAEATFMNCNFTASRRAFVDGVYAGDDFPSAEQFDAEEGAALYASGSEFAIINSSFVDFVSTNGVLFADLSKVRVTRSSFTGAIGSAISLRSTILAISDSQLLDNFAFYDGGAVLMDGSIVTASNVMFAHNVVVGSGGSIFGDSRSTLTASNCTFANCSAHTFGGAIFMQRQSQLSTQNCSFVTNAGSAVYLIDSASTFVGHSTFVGNSGASGGGLLVGHATAGAVVVFDSVFDGNTASTAGGGAFVTESASVEFRNTVFRGNSATISGGALGVLGSTSFGRVANVTLMSCILQQNFADQMGGAFAVASAVLTLSNCDVSRNEAGTPQGSVYGLGGGGYQGMGGVIDLHGSSFAGNVAVGTRARGGAICVDDVAVVLLSRLLLADNTATQGGAVFWRYDRSGQHLPCVQCVMSNNSVYDISTQADGVRLISSPSVLLSGLPASYIDQPGALYNVVDRYGQVDLLDSISSCSLTHVNVTRSVTIDNGGGFAYRGAISLAFLALRGEADFSYDLLATCTVGDGIMPSPGRVVPGLFTVRIAVCIPGWALNSVGVCTPCKETEYSPHGISCVPCPEGAVCVSVAEDGTRLGSVEPVAVPGFWLSAMDSNTRRYTCPLLNAARGSCNPGQYASGDTCVTDLTRYSPLNLYACTEGGHAVV